jgi:hypothetical protein
MGMNELARPATIVNDRPILSSKRAPQIKTPTPVLQ